MAGNERIEVEGCDTIPKLFWHQVKARADRTAFREKDLGIWQTWTWGRFADEVRALACGLAARGLKRGDHMALVGDNRPRIYAAMCAAQCLGAIPVPLYQDAVAAEMAYPIQNAQITHAVVEDQEPLRSLRSATLRHLRRYDLDSGLRSLATPGSTTTSTPTATPNSIPDPGRRSRRRSAPAPRPPRS